VGTGVVREPVPKNNQPEGDCAILFRAGVWLRSRYLENERRSSARASLERRKNSAQAVSLLGHGLQIVDSSFDVFVLVRTHPISANIFEQLGVALQQEAGEAKAVQRRLEAHNDSEACPVADMRKDRVEPNLQTHVASTCFT
jgi:hypothetical protein